MSSWSLVNNDKDDSGERMEKWDETKVEAQYLAACTFDEKNATFFLNEMREIYLLHLIDSRMGEA